MTTTISLHHALIRESLPDANNHKEIENGRSTIPAKHIPPETCATFDECRDRVINPWTRTVPAYSLNGYLPTNYQSKSDVVWNSNGEMICSEGWIGD